MPRSSLSGFNVNGDLVVSRSFIFVSKWKKKDLEPDKRPRFLSVPFLNAPPCLASDTVGDNASASRYKFLIIREVVPELICPE